MKDIQGIEDAMKVLEPHLKDIVADFERHNRAFLELMAHDHEVLGRVLKCHLIVEHYLDDFLVSHLGVANIHESRLSFYQKATLLPSQGVAAAVVRPGILRLNKIRNDFGHRLDAQLAPGDLGPIDEILRLARPGVAFDKPVEAIEAFATVACTWLLVPAEGLARVMSEALSKVQAWPE